MFQPDDAVFPRKKTKENVAVCTFIIRLRAFGCATPSARRFGAGPDIGLCGQFGDFLRSPLASNAQTTNVCRVGRGLLKKILVQAPIFQRAVTAPGWRLLAINTVSTISCGGVFSGRLRFKRRTPRSRPCRRRKPQKTPRGEGRAGGEAILRQAIGYAVAGRLR